LNIKTLRDASRRNERLAAREMEGLKKLERKLLPRMTQATSQGPGA
jgi:hypothetical protein